MAFIRIDKDFVNDPYLLRLAADLSDSLRVAIVTGRVQNLQAGQGFTEADNRNALRNLLLGVTVTLWSYADTHLRDDNTLPCNDIALADIVGVPVDILRRFPAKWIRFKKDGSIELPGFLEKSGGHSKDERRRQTRERVKKWREKVTRNCNANVAHVTRDCNALPIPIPRPRPKKRQKRVQLAASPLTGEVPPESLVSAWNELTDPPLPKVQTLSEGRRRKLKLRMRDRTLGEWRDVIAKVNKTPFLCGYNDRGWMASIDWLTANAENALKVLEGQYDGKGEFCKMGEAQRGSKGGAKMTDERHQDVSDAMSSAIAKPITIASLRGARIETPRMSMNFRSRGICLGIT